MSYEKNVSVGSPIAEKKETFVERWLIMPKLVYFMLNMFVYAFHGIMFDLLVADQGFTWVQYTLASCIVFFNFIGSFVWSPMADRTGRYKSIITGTAIGYTIVTFLMTLPYGKWFPGDGFISYVRLGWMFVLIAAFNFLVSAPFPLVDAQVMGLLVSDPRYSRNQFGNQRMFGCIGHFVATLIIFSAKDYTTGKADVFGFKLKHVLCVVFQIMITTVFIMVVNFGIPNVKPVKAGHHGSHGAKKAVSPAMSTASTTSGIPAKDVHAVALQEAIPMAPTPAPPSAYAELTAPGTEKVRHPYVRLLSMPSFVMFMLFVTCAGIVRSVTGIYQKPISIPIMDHNFTLTALTEGTRVISEISIYLMAPFLKRHMGSYWILVMSQLVGIFRMFGYAKFLTPGAKPAGHGHGAPAMSSVLLHAFDGEKKIVFLLELLKGFSSGLISSSAISIASEIAPEGCEATAQGLYSGNYSGASNIVAGALGAILLKWGTNGAARLPSDPEAHLNILDLQTVFSYMSLITFVVTVFMAAKFIFIDRVMGIPGFPRRRQSLAH